MPPTYLPTVSKRLKTKTTIKFSQLSYYAKFMFRIKLNSVSDAVPGKRSSVIKKMNTIAYNNPFVLLKFSLTV